MGADVPLSANFLIDYVDFMEFVLDVFVRVKSFVSMEPHLEENIPEACYQRLSPSIGFSWRLYGL